MQKNTIMTRKEAETRLQNIFGFSKFHDEQWEVISRILRGERVLMIQKTGFGKSLCYQFPATQFQGLTVIFSPLIALMRDQVRSLKSRGIPSAYINSEQSHEENIKTIAAAKAGKLKILYIAPERQENEDWIRATREMDLSMVVLDEAHTVSTWGHDFRPAFRRIIDLVNLLPSDMPVLATTATATRRVQADIERQIGGSIATIRGSLVRKNFHLYVVRVTSDDEKMAWIGVNLSSLNGTGLIYTGTRIEAERYARWLQHLGVSAIDYHAGFDADTRKEIEAGLMVNRWKAIVSTNALGMGLDKPDIRFVIHTQMPSSPVHYYQEIGRAGRDGKPTVVILLYNGTVKGDDGIPEDIRLPLSFIENARPSTRKYEKVIEVLKEEPLGERAVVKKANIKSPQFRIIKADLMEQGIIREVKYGSSKLYEYQYDAPQPDFSKFQQLKQMKLEELEKMREYVETEESRMKYLCRYLDGDDPDREYGNCDNMNLPKMRYVFDSGIERKLKEFHDAEIPGIELADYSSVSVKEENGGKVTWKVRTEYPDRATFYKDRQKAVTYEKGVFSGELTKDETKVCRKLMKSHYEKKSHITDGIAASYYGVSSVGSAIHRSKYENGGDFPDFLLTAALRAFYKTYGSVKFDLVCYIPPTKSGNLVKNFAVKFSAATNIPVSHALIKVRETQEQKIFQNGYSKKDNVKDAFDFADPDGLKGKTILLIDDIYDSGATLKEVGNMFTRLGAKWIVPLVIAKTVGGTI